MHTLRLIELLILSAAFLGLLWTRASHRRFAILLVVLGVTTGIHLLLTSDSSIYDFRLGISLVLIALTAIFYWRMAART